MDLDNEILTKDVCKDRDCSCWAPDTCRSVAHFTSFPSLAPPPPAGSLNVRTPYTVSVCHRAHSWRTKGTVSQACSIVCQTSCNISRYLVSPLPDQPPTAPLPRCSLQRALVDPALPPVRGADSYPVSAHGHVLPGDGGSHRDNEEGGEGGSTGSPGAGRPHTTSRPCPTSPGSSTLDSKLVLCSL